MKGFQRVASLCDEGLLFGNEVYELVGAAIEVHKELGPGFLESVYHEAYEVELRDRRIPFESQPRLEIHYKGRKLDKEFQADMIAFGEIIVELKCISRLTRTEEAQILNYLRATQKQVGLLINFGSTGKLEWQRYVMSPITRTCQI